MLHFAAELFQAKMTVTATISADAHLFEPVQPPNAPLNLKVGAIRALPYFDEAHFLHLSTLTPDYQAFALALQHLVVRDARYAFDTYEETFNIKEIILKAREYAYELNTTFENTSVYIIAFRSILKEEVQQSVSKRQWLSEIDKASHYEATESGGLIKYWYGVPDDEHAQNLATCLWTNKEDAVKGGGGKKHREGMNKVKSWYKHWKVEEYEVLINQDGYEWKRIK